MAVPKNESAAGATLRPTNEARPQYAGPASKINSSPAKKGDSSSLRSARRTPPKRRLTLSRADSSTVRVDEYATGTIRIAIVKPVTEAEPKPLFRGFVFLDAHELEAVADVIDEIIANAESKGAA